MFLTLAGTASAMRVIDRFDAALGDGVERAMIHHHMRRLRRHGQLAALAPATEGLWARSAPPPREGNAFEVLIDGANALPRMAEAIRAAKRHVHVCSWHLEPDFDAGPRKSSPVRELLAEPAERVPVRGAAGRARGARAGARARLGRCAGAGVPAAARRGPRSARAAGPRHEDPVP